MRFITPTFFLCGKSATGCEKRKTRLAWRKSGSWTASAASPPDTSNWTSWRRSYRRSCWRPRRQPSGKAIISWMGASMSSGAPGRTHIGYLLFEDLIAWMLHFYPAKRCTPFEALQHMFFRHSSVQQATGAEGTAEGAYSAILRDAKLSV